ncbi:MAG: MotA/TolQ/ExbB proton channel family protein [Planctomycetota bacterium]
MTDSFHRLRWLACVLLFVSVLNAVDVQWLAPSVAFAQDEPEKKAAEPTPEVENKSFVWWVIETSGPIGLLIFGLSVYFVALTSRLFLELRPTVAMPPDLMLDIEQKLEKRDYKGIYSSVKERDCLFSKITAAGMGELSNGLEESRDAMERVADVQVVEMEKKISMLAVLGTLGPMIGLLGTLTGMIRSFSVIARSDTQLKASEVAGGISEALLLTFEGVALSLPAIYFFAIFKNRVMSIAANTMLQADDFMKKLAQAAKAAVKAPQAPPQAPKEQPKV